MDKDQAIRKTQKLMAVAMDDRGNRNEAERALAQAEALIRKFGIEQAEIASTEAAADFDWAEAFHAYGPPQNPAKSCPKWFQIVSTGVATFTDTIVRLHYDAALGYSSRQSQSSSFLERVRHAVGYGRTVRDAERQ